MRSRGPQAAAAILAYREAHPEEMRAYQRKAVAVAAERNRELCADLEWLDAKRRRIPSSEREEIVRRWLAGASAAELARSCKVDPSTIRNIVAEQGDAGEHGRRLPRRRYLLTVEQEDELVRRRLAGESRRKLAAEFGCSPGYVYLLVKQRCTDLWAASSRCCACWRGRDH